MSKMKCQSWIAIAAAAFVAGGTVTAVSLTPARAEDMKPMMAEAGPASPELKKAAMECSAKMKEMANGDKMDKAKVKMAKVMVMDMMSMSLAKDSDFQTMTMSTMKDPAMMKTHEAAKTMVEDPATMKKLEEQITKDPEAMTIIVHNAAMMAMHHMDKMDK